MLSILKGLADRWAGWLGDRDLEQAIRRQLTDDGYFGDSARLKDVRLVAVERPGWLQVLVFSAEAREATENSDYSLLSGIVRQDERYNRLEIRIFQKRFERNELFESWSEGLVRLRRL